MTDVATQRHVDPHCGLVRVHDSFRRQVAVVTQHHVRLDPIGRQRQAQPVMQRSIGHAAHTHTGIARSIERVASSAHIAAAAGFDLISALAARFAAKHVMQARARQTKWSLPSSQLSTDT